ncbi:uncharacterized protein LOC103316599 [Nasonia vitripennis]|uniref:Uncharacterized protein n=1 Tax=Nasonia vitripennis TaxID=7425 RepID=A0A7M7QJU3_NASVI|nr:uncharacterized protein LOC103316599 [Nasonia vitripennis]XP_031787943.1 uncharacterized protein LOC103316599 [Nasonia vitripennis]
MSVFNTEKLKTEINTIADKNSEKMDSPTTTSAPRRSILKTPSTTFKEIIEAEENNRFGNNDLVPRPHNLDEFVQKESLNANLEMKPTFSIEDLDEDDEVWVVDVPGTIDPLQLKGQTLQFGDKSKIKIGEDKYSAINRSCKSNLTCVLNKDKTSHVYKTVNIKPAGSISIRRKLTNTSKKKIEYQKTGGVPYPKNIKVRHPFFGVAVDSSSVKTEKQC